MHWQSILKQNPDLEKIYKSLIREKLSKFSHLSFCQKLFFLNQTPSCICSMCLHCIGKVSNCSIKSAKYQIVPSKAVVGVDRPMKAPSMHVQKPY